MIGNRNLESRFESESKSIVFFLNPSGFLGSAPYFLALNLNPAQKALNLDSDSHITVWDQHFTFTLVNVHASVHHRILKKNTVTWSNCTAARSTLPYTLCWQRMKHLLFLLILYIFWNLRVSDPLPKFMRNFLVGPSIPMGI